MSDPIRLLVVISATQRDVMLPRGMVIAEAWTQLGDDVKALSNASGRPLARTVKLLLDPLILRPTKHPQFAGTTVAAEYAAALREQILAAGAVLAATADWFGVLKRVRRSRRIADGNPQELYFQRCYELAHMHGPPNGESAEALAREVIEEIHQSRGDKTVERLRAYITDAANRPQLNRSLESAWRDATVPQPAPPSEDLERFLADCTNPAVFTSLVTARAGSQQAPFDRAANACGLTVHRRVKPPVLGERASKSRLPWPFDRSILERMFASFTTIFHRESMTDIPTMVTAEIHRSAKPWQLSDEGSRVAMAAAWSAGDALSDDDTTWPAGHARTRLRSRWRRESYVRRVLRLPTAEASGVPEDLHADIVDVRRPYMRRLWVRLHGREVRSEPVDPRAVWDLLDGVLRSVIMDQRSRLRTALLRGALSGTGSDAP